jgi:diguanylate cyclase (GGDEF)-like protein
MTREDIEASEIELERARYQNEKLAPLYVLSALIGVSALSIPAAYLASLLASGIAQFLLTAAILALFVGPMLGVLLYFALKISKVSDQAMTTLEHQLKGAVRSSEHERRLANALEMAEGEPEVLEVVERAFSATAPSTPIELLLADNSHAHLSRMATSSPTGEPPNCSVDSPDQCPAARRAQVQRFPDSEALDACPKLRSRPPGRCGAICVPVSIMGRTVGVIHATSELKTSLDESAVQDLETLAKLAGARIGLLRVMTETQLQASTDSLTGLLNRRSLENRVQALRRDGAEFVVAMADLDHFKQLNDVHGHETGDRALRLFAQTLRTSLRNQDVVSRQGGEEFAVVLPGCSIEDAHRALESVRDHLLDAVRGAGLPGFTVSFGIVQAADAEDLTEMLARADAALMQAKRAGRDRVVVHDRHGGPLIFDSEQPQPTVNSGLEEQSTRAPRRPSTTLVAVTPGSNV